jgi:hypothetical protein
VEDEEEEEEEEEEQKENSMTKNTPKRKGLLSNM